jgi:hypothetical protein
MQNRWLVKALGASAGVLLGSALLLSILTESTRADELLAANEPAVQAEAIIANPANLRFEEDFEDEASIQRFVFSSPEHWQRVRAGDRWALEHRHAGAAYQPPHRSPHNIALIADQKVGSFVLDYEAQQTGRDYGHRDACVFFNFVDPAHYYYAHVATQSDPHAHQIFTVNDAPRIKITRMGTSGFDWGPVDRWHQVRVVRDLPSGLIEVYVDRMDEPIMRASDTTHGSGYVGFGSFDDTGRVTNIRLYASEVQSQRATVFKDQ